MAFPDDELDITVNAYLGADPTADPGDWPAPTDLSARLLNEPIVITRGRPSGQSTAAAGSCTFTLTNDAIGDGTGANAAGVLTPLLATSTYYPDWDLNCPVAIEVNNAGASPPYRRFSGFVASIVPDVVPIAGGGTSSVVRVTLSGVLRQIGQGSVSKTALRRSIQGSGAVAYWPMEDGATAGYFGSGVSGGALLSVTDADLAGTDDLPGSGALATFSATTALDGTVDHTFSGQWSLIWFAKFPAVLGGLATLLEVQTPAGAAARWTVAADATTVRLTGYDPVGATVFSGTNTTTVFNAMFSGEWVGIGLEADASGSGTVTCNVYDLDGFRNGFGVTTGPNIGSPTHVHTPPSSFLVGMAMGHLAALTATGPSYVWPGGGPGGPTAANAYDGEQAHERFERVCAEEGITVSSFATESWQMGPQTEADVLTVLRDAETVDHAIMLELLDDWGLGFREHQNRNNRDASLTIDLDTYRTAQGTTSQVLVPARTDYRIRNEWTSNRPAGSTATVADAEHQSRYGRYQDSADVNVATDDMLVHDARWHVAEGTVNLLRYGRFPIDVGANASDLLDDWLALDLGDRIDRTNHPAPPHPHDTIRALLEGYRETLTRTSWTVDAVVEHYQPWEVRVWAEESPPDLGDHMGRWATERHCAIRAVIDSDDTSVLIDTPIGRWTTTAADLNESNYDALYARVGGETMKVTAVATTACTVVAAGTADHDDNAAVTPADYAGGAANDWAFVVARARGSTASLAITDSNYTYTLLRQQGGLYLWATVRGVNAPAPTITPSGSSAGDTISAVAFGFASMPITLDDLTDALILTVANANPTDQDIDYRGLRAGSLPGRLILLVAGKSDDWTGVAPPSGFNELVDVSSTTGNDQGLYVAYRIDTTPVAVAGGKLAVTGGAAATSESMVLALGSGFQTLTVARSQNGVIKSHAAGDLIETVDPLIWAL